MQTLKLTAFVALSITILFVVATSLMMQNVEQAQVSANQSGI